MRFFKSFMFMFLLLLTLVLVSFGVTVLVIFMDDYVARGSGFAVIVGFMIMATSLAFAYIENN